MQYRRLGRTGIDVSVIALGCEGFMHKPTREVKADFDFAIDHGINFIDIYSPNPELRTNFGLALDGRRDKFVLQGHLCTVWENGQYLRTRNEARIIPAFEDQLRELRTDHIDIGMIHYVDAVDDFHRVFDGPVIDIARRLKDEGKILHLGMSSHNPVVARMAVESGLIDVIMFSINPAYDLLPPSEDVDELFERSTFEHARHNIDPERESLYELCEREGVAIDVMKVYAGGNLLNAADSPFGKAMTAVQTIDYALSRPAVAAVILGCKNRDEIAEALHWCDASADERDYSSVITSAERFTWQGHCMYCGHCAPCTAGIDIAMVNKLYNLTLTQGMIPETVREHYHTLAHHASECVGCHACERRCPFGVEIVDSMHRAAEKFGY
ncbi:MAG: aldo/keto reductase [Bacteroidales bacterium]|nr:aldo/keto reductase [Bacteroidales bacterium]